MTSGGPPSGPPTGYRTTGYAQPRHASSYTQASSSSSVAGDAFSPQMRDRQARGKDPYHSGDGSEGSDLSDREPGTRLRLGNSRLEKEDFSRAERRHKAVAFLDSPELLMMYAQSTGDSIPGARLHFMKMMCGYDDEGVEDTRKSSSHQHPHGPSSHHGQSRRDPDKRRGGDRANTAH